MRMIIEKCSNRINVDAELYTRVLVICEFDRLIKESTLMPTGNCMLYANCLKSSFCRLSPPHNQHVGKVGLLYVYPSSLTQVFFLSLFNDFVKISIHLELIFANDRTDFLISLLILLCSVLTACIVRVWLIARQYRTLSPQEWAGSFSFKVHVCSVIFPKV